jgi:hypothetical protein
MINSLNKVYAMFSFLKSKASKKSGMVNKVC